MNGQEGVQNEERFKGQFELVSEDIIGLGKDWDTDVRKLQVKSTETLQNAMGKGVGHFRTNAKFGTYSEGTNAYLSEVF